MNIIDICQEVVNNKQCVKIKQRVKSGTSNQWEVGEYDKAEYGEGHNRHWTLLDLFTASVLLNVYNAWIAKHPDKASLFLNMPLPTLVDKCYKIIA